MFKATFLKKKYILEWNSKVRYCVVGQACPQKVAYCLKESGAGV